MRKLFPLIVALVIVAAACSSADDSASSDTTSPTAADAPTTTEAALTVPPQLADHDVDLVPVGDRLLLLAVADTPPLRAQGLKQVEDLGDLDGMLFSWDQQASGAFWMQDTVIPLDIVWFDEDGRYVGRASMVPCEADPCETYAPAGDPDYRYAIEADPGELDWVDDSTVIVYGD